MAEQNTTVKLTLDQAVQTREALRERRAKLQNEASDWMLAHPGQELPDDIKNAFGGTETALMKF